VGSSLVNVLTTPSNYTPPHWCGDPMPSGPYPPYLPDSVGKKLTSNYLYS